MSKLQTILMAISIFMVVANGYALINNNYTDAYNPLNYNIGLGDGESMEPQIYSYDIIIYETNTLTEADKGDTIVYTAQNKAIAHEYVGGNATRGINNNKVDPSIVTSQNYKGEVVQVVHTSKLIP